MRKIFLNFSGFAGELIARASEINLRISGFSHHLLSLTRSLAYASSLDFKTLSVDEQCNNEKQFSNAKRAKEHKDPIKCSLTGLSA